MKNGRFLYGLSFVLILCLLAFPLGCGSPGGSGNIDNPVVQEEQAAGEEEGVEAEEEPVESVADHINVTVNPGTITVEGSATATADVRRENNNPVPDGTTVTWSLQSSSWGTITASSTTTSGIATATFTAANQPGTTRITATSGSASDYANITIEQVPAAAIQFVSADPDVIALAGTGGDEISEIQFRVVDSNGNPLEGISVDFTMVGPNGGEYIQPASTSTNGSGIAMVRLYSGNVAGPVTVSATTDVGDPPTPMTVQSTVVSIGGGVPSDGRFSVASTILNIAGRTYNGLELEISAWLADRFGSYNVLEGTTVSFGTEVGLATDTSSVTLGDDGVASVTVRTQAGAGGKHAEDVLPQPWEQALQTYVAGAYGYTTTRHPHDGVVTVLVYTKGEEHFDDLNANGVYDSGTDLFLPAYDTAEDPFYDYDDDGQYNDGATYPVTGPPYNPAEIFIDSSPANGTWDGPDGVWSADTYLFRNFPILVTGPPMFLVRTGDLPFTVPDGGAQEIRFLVCDQNFNIPIGGTTLEVNSNKGGLIGTLDYEYPDSNAIGSDLASHLALIEYSIWVYDNDLGDGNPPEAAEVTVDISWQPQDKPLSEWSYILVGTID